MSEGQGGYTSDFRRKVVEMVREGRSPAELARELKPSVGTIRRWVSKAREEAGLSGPGERIDKKSSAKLEAKEREELLMLRKEMRAIHDDREELSRLREENHALREERDILRQDKEVLKKAVAKLFGQAEDDFRQKEGYSRTDASAEDQEQKPSARSGRQG